MRRRNSAYRSTDVKYEKFGTFLPIYASPVHPILALMKPLFGIRVSPKSFFEERLTPKGKPNDRFIEISSRLASLVISRWVSNVSMHP